MTTRSFWELVSTIDDVENRMVAPEDSDSLDISGFQDFVKTTTGIISSEGKSISEIEEDLRERYCSVREKYQWTTEYWEQYQSEEVSIEVDGVRYRFSVAFWIPGLGIERKWLNIGWALNWWVINTQWNVIDIAWQASVNPATDIYWSFWKSPLLRPWIWKGGTELVKNPDFNRELHAEAMSIIAPMVLKWVAVEKVSDDDIVLMPTFSWNLSDKDKNFFTDNGIFGSADEFPGHIPTSKFSLINS